MTMKKETFIKDLTDILVSKHFLTSSQAQDMQRAFATSAIEEYDQFLLEEGLVATEDMLTALSHYYKIPSYDVANHFFDTFYLHKFPKDFLVRNAVIPLEREENILLVVAAEPERPGLASAMREFVSYDIRFLVGIRLTIIDAIREFYDKSVTQVVEDEDSREEHLESQKANLIIDSSDKEEGE